MQFFSGTKLQHGLSVRLLEILDLTLVLFADIEGIGAESILHTPSGVLHPFLDLGGGKIKGPTGFGHRGLALQDLDHQGALPLGSPALPRRGPIGYVFLFHHHAHCALLTRLTPEQVFSGSIQPRGGRHG